eukprot:gene13698-19590_t
MWSSVSLATVSVVKLVALTSLTLIPIKGNLDMLLSFQGWLQLYRFALSNLDILAISLFKSALIAALILPSCSHRGPTAAQAKTTTSSSSSTILQSQRSNCSAGEDEVQLQLEGRRGPTAARGKTTRNWIGSVCGLFQTFLILKSVGVAVSAPDEVWPTPPSLPGEGFFIGLAFMYTTIILALFASFFECWLAKEVVRHSEAASKAASQASGESDSLAVPLLGAIGDEESGSGSTAPAGTANANANAGDVGAGKAKDGKEGDEDQTKFSRETLMQLLRMSSHEWPIIVVAFSAGGVAALAQALIPYWTGQVIDYASIEPDENRFRQATIYLLISAFVCAAFSGVRGGLFTLIGTKLNVRIRKMLFHSLMMMEIGFFDTTKSGDITSRLTADTETAAGSVCLNMNIMLRSATQAVMVLGFMFWASWRLTVITFVLLYGGYFAKLSKKVQTELAEANAAAQEVLSSMTTVKAHGAQDSSEAMYSSKLLAFYNLNVKEAIAYASYATITTFLPNLVAAVVLYYGGQLVLSGQMSPGALVSFMLYHQSLSSAFSSIGDVFSYLTAAVGAAEKVIELINRKPKIDPGGHFIPQEGLVGKLELQAVVFTYPSRPSLRVLCGLSLVADPGETVALVGVSGGGKSSIVKLIERFYLPHSGSVLVDGRDVGVYDAKWLRRQVALVSQEPVLYARSIRRNIMYGLEAADGMPVPPSQEEVEEAARQANAHDFISSFPEKYETDCGEKGITISGGQKQRIAIARALVRKPRVLLLDEATSALDADSEAVVQEALDRMMSGRTTLVIAHRLSTIQGADRIIVIGKGVVQESGTHAELLEAGGAYANLVHRQLTRVQSSTVSLKSLTTPPITPVPSTVDLKSLAVFPSNLFSGHPE